MKEIEKIKFQVLLSSDDYKWVAGSKGEVPMNAVIGGEGVNIDGTDYSEKFFIGRALHEGIYIPGKIQPSHGLLYFPIDGNEAGDEHYHVLVKETEDQHVLTPQKTSDPEGSNPPKNLDITSDEAASSPQKTSDPEDSTFPKKSEIIKKDAASNLQKTKDSATTVSNLKICDDTISTKPLNESPNRKGIEEQAKTSVEGFKNLIENEEINDSFKSMENDTRIWIYTNIIDEMDFFDYDKIEELNDKFPETKSMKASFKNKDNSKEQIYWRVEGVKKFLCMKLEEKGETAIFVNKFIEESFDKGHSGKRLHFN